jgi:hypothetical protein
MEEGAALALQFGCEFLETSAKTAQNVERLFKNLVCSLQQTGTPPPPVKKGKKFHKCVIYHVGVILLDSLFTLSHFLPHSSFTASHLSCIFFTEISILIIFIIASSSVVGEASSS